MTGTLRVGESCGCFGSTLIEKNSSVAARNVDDFIQMAEHIRENNDSIVTFLLNSLGIRMNKSYYSKNISELLLVFAKDLEQQNQNGPFLLHLNRMIQGDVSRMRSTIEWENFLIAIKSYILGRLPSVEIISWLNELLFNAYTFVSRIMVRKERSNDYSTHLLHNATMYLIYLFTNVTTIEGMIDLTRRQVKYWAFKELYICLYDEVALFSENERFKIPEKIHLKFGYQNNQEVSSEIFDVKDMLPSSILKSDERIEVVFQPLFFGFNQFGYIVVDLETSKSVLYIALKEQIANLLERKLLLDQLEAKNNQLQIISRMDALTGLYNRRGFYELSEAAFQEAIENDQRISIIYGDLDGLKGVNDRYGHHEGDSFIRTIANILRASCEDEAIIGRVGGDEFIICQVEDASRTSGFETLERILNQLEKLNRKKKKPYATSISLGISIYDPEKPLIFEELIKVADADLYNQKSKKKHSSI